MEASSAQIAIEIAKAIGPYVTAVAAILGIALTAWFTQRNWFRQQRVLQSQALRQQQMALLREVPEKLVHSGLIFLELTYRAVIIEAIIELGAKLGSAPTSLTSLLDSATARIKELGPEAGHLQPHLVALALTVTALFGDRAGGLMRDVMEAQLAIGSDAQRRAAMRSQITGTLENAITQELSMPAVMARFQYELPQSGMALTKESAETLGKLIVEMAAVGGFLQLTEGDRTA